MIKQNKNTFLIKILQINSRQFQTIISLNILKIVYKDYKDLIKVYLTNYKQSNKPYLQIKCKFNNINTNFSKKHQI